MCRGSMKNKERLVELLKDNELCRECGKKICTGCGAYLSLWQEAEMLDKNGVFCPPVKIGAEVFVVIDDWDPAFGEPVRIGVDKVVDVSVRGIWLGTDESNDLVLWEELDKKEEFFLDKAEAEERYDLLMQKYQNATQCCVLKTNSCGAINDFCDSRNLSSGTRCEEMAKYE